MLAFRSQRFWNKALLLVTGLLAIPNAAQAQLPQGWQNLSAAEFLEAAKSALPAEQQAVAAHAWSQFLSVPEFVSAADWPVVQEMLQRYANQEGIAGVDAEAKAKLRGRVDARVAADPTFVTGKKLFELHWAVKALEATGHTAADRADMFVAWMQANDWQSLAIHNQYNLYEWINLDSLDRRHCSVRWTGSLTAPFTRAYTIRQIRPYKGDHSRLKVTIGGAVVLDTSDPRADASRFTSAPIQLTAEQPIPIQVEIVHDVAEIDRFSAGVPMAVLTWESSGMPETIIPSTAFEPPAGFGEAGTHGLKGEYFANTDFSELRLTRLDPALDLVSSWPPLASARQQAASEVFNACVAKLLDDEFLAKCVTENKPKVFSYNMWRIAYRMAADQRRQLVDKLRTKPQVLALMTPEAMGRLMQAIYMLPGDAQLELLGEWALNRPQPRCVAGRFPGWGYGYYQEQNTDYYWLIGYFLQGPYQDDANTLMELYLTRPDGECNLAIAYAAAFAARANGTGLQYLAMLDEQIDDPALSGDQRMTWLVAKAFALEALPGQIEPLAGYSELQTAFLTAESNDHKFWALQEIVARLSSTGRAEDAQALIQQHQGQFTLPDQQAAMTEWVAKANELAAEYAQREGAQAQASRQAYLGELVRRRERAAARGDEAGQQRLSELIENLQAAPPTP